MRVGLEIPGGERRVNPALCHPAMRGDPGIRALLVQARSPETESGWCRDSSERNKGTEWGDRKARKYSMEVKRTGRRKK